MNPLSLRILVAIDDAQADIDTRPKLSDHAPWWRRSRDDADRTDGPLWMPSVMLADAEGEPMPDRVRAAANRTLAAMVRSGHVVITGDGGRRRVRLTDAGRLMV